MLKKFFTKLRNDRADSVLVTVILTMPALMLGAGFAADMSKSAYVSTSYSSMAQRSVETAVTSINAKGSLDNNSVRKFVSEFQNQSNGSTSHTNETLTSGPTGCSTRVINGVTRQLPYMEITLGTARGNSSIGDTTAWKIPDGTSVTNQVLDPKVKYKVISADVYTGSPNFILGMFGVPCQYLKSSVSAISFGDNTDLK
jgi:hypothetical protein